MLGSAIPVHQVLKPIIRVKAPESFCRPLIDSTKEVCTVILRPITKIRCASMTVAAVDLYRVPAVRLDLPVHIVNSLLYDCGLSSLHHELPLFSGPGFQDEDLVLSSLELVYPFFAISGLIDKTIAALIWGLSLEKAAGSVKKVSKKSAHQYAIQGVPGIAVSSQSINYITCRAIYCNRVCPIIRFRRTQIANPFELLLHGLLPVPNFLKTVGFFKGNFAGPHA